MNLASYTVILLQMVMVNPGLPIPESQSRATDSQFKNTSPWVFM